MATHATAELPEPCRPPVVKRMAAAIACGRAAHLECTCARTHGASVRHRDVFLTSSAVPRRCSVSATWPPRTAGARRRSRSLAGGLATRIRDAAMATSSENSWRARIAQPTLRPRTRCGSKRPDGEERAGWPEATRTARANRTQNAPLAIVAIQPNCSRLTRPAACGAGTPAPDAQDVKKADRRTRKRARRCGQSGVDSRAKPATR